jgi:C1A family cysteine protease
MADDMPSVASIQEALRTTSATWEAGENAITALSETERARLLGVAPPPGAPTAEQMARRAPPPAIAFESDAIAAPAAYDLRNVSGNNYVTPIKNQGGCGSCVAFGVASIIETKLRLQRGNPGLAVDLSEAHLFFCYARDEGRNCGNGWWPQNALEKVKQSGVCDEACFPYTDRDQDCSGRCADWAGRSVKISGYTNLTNQPAQMKEWLSTRGALSACFVVFGDFFAYRSGVYRHVSGTNSGGHCVAIVGYDDAQGCWICKNSWGAGWGESGFFRIAYGQCSIESWLVHGVDAIVETGWLNNVRVTGLWAINQDRNVWIYLAGIGWRRLAFDNDVITTTMLADAIIAKAAQRPVNVYQDNGVIKQIYVF